MNVSFKVTQPAGAEPKPDKMSRFLLLISCFFPPDTPHPLLPLPSTPLLEGLVLAVHTPPSRYELAQGVQELRGCLGGAQIPSGRLPGFGTPTGDTEPIGQVVT